MSLLLSLLSKVKVKSTPSLRPKTWSLTKIIQLHLKVKYIPVIQNWITDFDSPLPPSKQETEEEDKLVLTAQSLGQLSWCCQYC